MSAGIQEDEMLMASKYCKNFDKELTAVLTAQSNAYNANMKACEDKIRFEQQEIQSLKDQINACNNHLNANKKRLEEIPGEITSAKSDISACEWKISCTPVPAYKDVWIGDWERGHWRSVVDHEATYENEQYIADQRERIADDNNQINFLNSETERCNSNIRELVAMTGEINGCISQKQNLISQINADISLLNNEFGKLKNKISDLQSKNNELDHKIIQAAEFIHNYGTTMATISYGGVKLSYSSGDVFAMQAADLSQEINMLHVSFQAGMNNLSQCRNGTLAFNNLLQDDVSKSAGELTAKALLSMKKINESYLNCENIMKKALAFLSSYESVKM